MAQYCKKSEIIIHVKGFQVLFLIFENDDVSCDYDFSGQSEEVPCGENIVCRSDWCLSQCENCLLSTYS